MSVSVASHVMFDGNSASGLITVAPHAAASRRQAWQGARAPRCIPKRRIRTARHPAQEGAAQARRNSRQPAATCAAVRRPSEGGARLDAATATKPVKRRAPWRGRPRVDQAKGRRIAVRLTDDDHSFSGTNRQGGGAKRRRIFADDSVRDGGRAGGETSPYRPQAAGETSGRNRQARIERQPDRKVGEYRPRRAELGRDCKMREDIAAMRGEVMKALDRGD